MTDDGKTAMLRAAASNKTHGQDHGQKVTTAGRSIQAELRIAYDLVIESSNCQIR